MACAFSQESDAGIKVCCGGIVGMGECVEDWLGMLVLLAIYRAHPESVPINLWHEAKGVPVDDTRSVPIRSRWCAL